MTKTYITVQGDTWDIIAYKQLGSEYSLPILLEANKEHRSTVIFSGGIKLDIPKVDTSIVTERPAWLGEDEEL
ncbi:tail protein X [Cytobacillus sp. IB215665]|uniref:tail protein X n=1 Tax=Cytobacillus sp. IB215665 TaxID=3097357 RepID=UPI002A15B843|nr:tail protein X [Cytobacillus sp. IB215665]MDX8367786.1 tail protein X [Cytobacillus sp. IB215665]